jgi:protein TonB
LKKYLSTSKLKKMKAEKILQSSLLDLLFENRNKEYGAYELRKNYALRLKKAIFFSIATAFLLFISLTSFTKKNLVSTNRIYEEQIMKNPLSDEKPKEKPKTEKPKGVDKSNAPKDNYTSVVKLVDTKETANVPNMNNTYNPQGDPKFFEGGFDGPIGDPEGRETGKDTITTEKEPIKEPLVINEPPKPTMSASYKGGREAMGAYLQDKLGDENLEENEPKKITVSFWVETDGTITNVKTEGNEDQDFAQKTIRTFLKMKKWNPAVQLGTAVREFKVIPVNIMPDNE